MSLRGKWDLESDLYITGTVTNKIPFLGPAGLCWDRTTYQLAQIYLKKFRPFYTNESSLFPCLPGYATRGEPFFITKDGNPMDSNKGSGMLATMATILYPNLKGKMSGKRIRKSAIANFRKLPAAVTLSIFNRNLAQHMPHSDTTADRFHNLSDIVRDRAHTAAFIKTTIIGQADEELSASCKDLPDDIKKRLLDISRADAQ